MTLDVTTFIDSKGGNAEGIRESQRKRGEPVELVDQVIAMYAEWVKKDYELNGLNKQVNAVQKEIGTKKKAKEPADDLVAQKKVLDAEVEAKRKETREYELLMRQKASNVGNLVAKDVPVSLTEDDNLTLRTWHPDGPNGQVEKKTHIMPHHEVLLRLDAMDLERGTKVVGHRGYFLTDDGVDLNQALISYALDFLRKRGYKKIQPPFMVNKDVMSKTAQLSQFDEELYKVIADEDEKYLIATSEQPISAFHTDEWFEDPKTQLPIYYAGFSTCFRKEAGSAGRDMWGIFRVHQFEKVEQFVITAPEESWNAFDTMLANSEAFYQSLGLPYRVVAIGAYKELVSCSNCTDYQSRRLEVRCGLKSKDQQRKVYVHMLNGTMCATERALCCLVENYQTTDGLVIPEVLRPYMQGRDFLPWKKALPKSLLRKQA
ncbi:serine-tRNA ligase [Butyriboletus roseoflavus]|nr:serine-tRNA ligase [Butyriboletus roseoflavus]